MSVDNAVIKGEERRVLSNREVSTSRLRAKSLERRIKTKNDGKTLIKLKSNNIT